MHQRLVLLSLLVVACVCSADFADNVYDGSLAPFSYAELQAEMTPSSPIAPSSTVFLAPESLIETRTRAAMPTPPVMQQQARSAGEPVAFPFEQPPLPADLALGADRFRSASPYAYTQNEMLQNLASTVDAAVANAPGQFGEMNPLGLVEAGSSIRRSAGITDLPLVAPGTPGMLPSQAAPTREEMLRDPTQDMAAAPTMSLNAQDPHADMRYSQVQASPALTSASSTVQSAVSNTPQASASIAASSAVPTSSGLPSITHALSSLGTPAGAVPQSSSSHHHHGSSSSVTPIHHKKKKHRCIPKSGGACVVDIDPRSVDWKVVTVPQGTLGDTKPESVRSHMRSHSSSSSSSSSSSGSHGHRGLLPESAYHQEFSENPTIAAAQKVYYDKQAELMKEKRWIVDVKRIIEEYQFKIRNVQRHTTLEEMELSKSRKNIVNMIKAEKSKKLAKELHAALDSLKKLEMTSQALNNKMSELSHTKQGLQHTISKIQRVIGPKGSHGASFVETAEDVTDSHLAAQSDANDSAKQLFASLLQMVSKAQQSTSEKEKALRSAYADHHVSYHDDREVPMHTHGTHLRAINDAEARRNADTADVDLAEIDAKAHSIADKYVKEENKELHTNFPLRTLALRDLRKADDNDLFLDF